MSTASLQILRTLHLKSRFQGLATNRQRITQFHRNLHVGSSDTDSVLKKNRRRALEYLQKYSREENGTRPDHSKANEEFQMPTHQAKPSAKEMAQERLRKHIPVVTGRVPAPDQLAQLLESGHGAQNVAMLDVRQKASFADWLLLCCGVTSNHVLAIADGIAQDMRALDVLVDGEIVTVSGRNSSDWMVVDVGPTVIHVMTDEARDHYRLEELWLPERIPPNDSSALYP